MILYRCQYLTGDCGKLKGQVDLAEIKVNMQRIEAIP